MNWQWIFAPTDYIQMRRRRRQALRMLVYSGCVRSASHGIRYGLTPGEQGALRYARDEECINTNHINDVDTNMVVDRP